MKPSWRVLAVGLPIGMACMGQGLAHAQATNEVESAQPPAQDAVPAVKPDINPYDRDINLTAPLQFNSRILGEIDVLLTRTDDIYVQTDSFLRLIEPLLTPAAQEELRLGLGGLQSFTPEQIQVLGVRLEYDPQQLAILVLRIDPSKRSIENIFRESRRDDQGRSPEDFTAYLNTNLVLTKRSDQDSLDKPSVFLNGAVRAGNVVFETDIQGRQSFDDDSYEVFRRYARVVYDQPEHYRRFFVGDLDPETRGRQGFAQIGGVGVVRQRQRFDSYRANALVGNRQLLLEENSTVRILRNGVLQRELVLDAGQYDVSNLPLEVGSNDIELEVVGQSGQLNTVRYSAYLDVIDLEPGDYEYGAYFGVNSDFAFGSPNYDDGEMVFTGYYRKAFLNAPAVGVGLQATESVQTVSAQSQIILGSGARIRFDGAASNADFGTGYAAGIGIDYVIDRGIQLDSLTVSADFTSEEFAVLGNDFGVNPTSWQVTGNYTRVFNERWTGSLVGNYRISRVAVRGDGYSLNAFTNYRINPRWAIQAGLEYVETGSNSPFSRDGFGVSFALIWQPGFDRRAEARYNSARNSGSVRYSKTTENRVGAYGYSLSSTYEDGPGSVSGQVDYIGNRFAATLSHGAFGSDFGSIGDRQITSLRIGSSIAAAGDAWGVGRNIFDSFAIVRPHPSLDSPVIVGDTLAQGRYVARSGMLGGAVANNLISYINQSVRHDALDPPPGYDTGSGVTRVFPSYRSGYDITVGRADFVSALGRLVDRNQRPISLVSGRIRPVDEPDAKPELFFTNSAGRFAVQNLTPGRRYLIELPSLERSLEISVPEDSEGLLDLQQVTLSVETADD
jgi:outer membrane usher protein